MTRSDLAPSAPTPPWTLMTSHGLVLLFVAINGNVTIRHMATSLDLSERRIADIIRDLSDAGLVLVERCGRRNQYALNRDARFRHPMMADIPFHKFVTLWERESRRAKRKDEAAPKAAAPS